MSERRTNFSAVLAFLLPLGSIGTSAALAAAPGKPAEPTGAGQSEARDVAGRLHAIREAVSQAVVEDPGSAGDDARIEKAWWGNWHPGWRNGGWGWRNGGWGWRNGGWGWANGGWPNWHNGWHNGGWGNFWRNW
jgi:rSAM-associated Gly-rich repeat protein